MPAEVAATVHPSRLAALAPQDDGIIRQRSTMARACDTDYCDRSTSFARAGDMQKFFIVLAFTLIALLSPAHADNYPSRPITLIVPFPPGGSTDVAARIMADKMGAALGQPVIVENVGGAGASIGVGRLARSTPDGYTIDIGQWDTHVGTIIYNINFDLRSDFAPIGLISINPMLLVAKKGLPAHDLKSLVYYMKAPPGGG